MSQPDTDNPTVTHDYQPDEERFVINYKGDAPHIRIKTPDFCLFIVSASLLSHASPVFKAMIEICDTNDSAATLELTDESLELSEHVEVLIECMRGDFPLIENCEVYVIELAQKYECLEVLAGLELRSYRECTNRPHACRWSGIYEAIALHAWPLLGQLICDMANYGKAHEDFCTLKTWNIDPRTWTPKDVQDYNRHGPHFVWAMTQAAFETYNYETKTYNCRRMGRIFSQLMAEAEKDTCYKPSQEKSREIAPLSEGRDGNNEGE